MIRSRCVRLLTSTHLELSRNPRLIFKDGFEVRLTGKWVSDHGAQSDDGNPFVLSSERQSYGRLRTVPFEASRLSD